MVLRCTNNLTCHTRSYTEETTGTNFIPRYSRSELRDILLCIISRCSEYHHILIIVAGHQTAAIGTALYSLESNRQ